MNEVMKKVYVIIIKETGELTSRLEAYESFEKAKKDIYEALKEHSHERELRETELKNEFEVWDKQGNRIHTLQIVDLWVH